MTDTALRTLEEVDLILFIVDNSHVAGPGDKYITELLTQVKTPAYLLINKIDLIEPEQYKTLFEEYEKSGIFKEIIGISALENKNVDTLVEKLKDSVEEGPMYFPADQVTDHPERFLVGEIIREKLLKYLEDEIPHGVAVEIEAYEEKTNITNISAVIYCEKKSHKGMIIGKEGRKLKGVGKSAREDMEALLGTKVFLQLWVKVKENWRDSDTALSGFGYKE